MRQQPDPRVQNWLDAQVVETLYLSTVSLSEILLGIENLPTGKRRRALAASLIDQIVQLFAAFFLSISRLQKPTRMSSLACADEATQSLSLTDR